MREEGVKFLKELINKLRPDRYYAIYWPHIVLEGDLFHTPPNPLHKEHWLTTSTPGMRFIRIKGGFEYLYVPTRYAYRIEIETPLSFHLKVKPKVELLTRKYRWEHYIKNPGIPLEQYVKQRVIEDYGTDNLEEAAEKYCQELMQKLVPYDKNTFGDYPEILKEHVYRKFGIRL